MLMYLILWPIAALASYYLVSRSLCHLGSWSNGDRALWMFLTLLLAPAMLVVGLIINLDVLTPKIVKRWLRQPAKW